MWQYIQNGSEKQLETAVSFDQFKLQQAVDNHDLNHDYRGNYPLEYIS
jgi:hypothetical protein